MDESIPEKEKLKASFVWHPYREEEDFNLTMRGKLLRAGQSPRSRRARETKTEVVKGIGFPGT